MHPSYIPEYPGSKFLIELAHADPGQLDNAISIYRKFKTQFLVGSEPRACVQALLHESDVARNDPNPTVGHRLLAYDAGLPKSVIRFSTLHARTASVPCPAELRARRPSPMIDLYRKKTFSTRACRW